MGHQECRESLHVGVDIPESARFLYPDIIPYDDLICAVTGCGRPIRFEGRRLRKLFFIGDLVVSDRNGNGGTGNDQADTWQPLARQPFVGKVDAKIDPKNLHLLWVEGINSRPHWLHPNQIRRLNLSDPGDLEFFLSARADKQTV